MVRIPPPPPNMNVLLRHKCATSVFLEVSASLLWANCIFTAMVPKYHWRNVTSAFFGSQVLYGKWSLLSNTCDIAGNEWWNFLCFPLSLCMWVNSFKVVCCYYTWHFTEGKT